MNPPLLLVVALAFFVEAVTGFGATLVAVALGGLLVPLRELLPAFVPVNLGLSLLVLGSDPRAVDRRLLVGRVLPAMAVGFPVGALGFRLLGQHAGALELGFAAFVIGVAGLRLAGRGGGGGPVAIGLAGVVHGAFGTGGPILVAALGDLGLGKGAFRATLAAVWAVLGVGLLASYALAGALTPATLAVSASLLPALAAGLALGQVVHTGIDAARFRRAVDVLLLAAGAFMLARAIGVRT